MNTCPANWTRYYGETSTGHQLDISVAPGADLDGTFTAWCHDEDEMIRVNGWLWDLEPAAD